MLFCKGVEDGFYEIYFIYCGGNFFKIMFGEVENICCIFIFLVGVFIFFGKLSSDEVCFIGGVNFVCKRSGIGKGYIVYGYFLVIFYMDWLR